MNISTAQRNYGVGSTQRQQVGFGTKVQLTEEAWKVIPERRTESVLRNLENLLSDGYNDLSILIGRKNGKKGHIQGIPVVGEKAGSSKEIDPSYFALNPNSIISEMVIHGRNYASSEKAKSAYTMSQDVFDKHSK